MKSTSRPRHLITMGGGGFSMEPQNLRLDRYILALTNKPHPRVCFVPTASGDSESYIRRFGRAMKRLGAGASVLALFRLDGRDVTKHLLKQDVIYVGGGSTVNLLALWRLHGIDRAMHQAWHQGVILCGVSAGMICWFESSVTDSFGPLCELKDGLGFLPGSACPHYDSAAGRRAAYHRLIEKKILPAGVAADDGAAIHFTDKRIFKCVSSRPSARVYRVERQDRRVIETPLATEYLETNRN